MANNVVKAPIFRAIASRSYSSSKLTPISGVVNEVHQTVLPNNLVVASVDTGSPISRLSVSFRAGSRYENYDTRGAAHLLRITAGLSTKNATQFAIVRNIQQAGGSLTCTTDRETVSYTLTGSYEAVRQGSEYLSEIAGQQVFKPWEVADSTPRLKLELASLSPEIRAINFLHKVAYRAGLGNSLFCAKHLAGKISSETLQHYVAQTFGSDRAAVIGLGIEHSELLSYAKNISFATATSSKTEPSKYHGGEIRSEKGGDLAYVAIATEGVGIQNQRDSIALQILQRALGTSSYVKWGTESSSPLNQAVSKCVEGAPFGVSAFNANYSDSGLFGIFVIAPASLAGNVVNSAHCVLRSGQVTDKDVARAKNQLKLAKLLEMENGESCIHALCNQALLTGATLTPQQMINDIDSVTTGDVKKMAEKVACGKFSMASVGNLVSVPYLDELK